MKSTILRIVRMVVGFPVLLGFSSLTVWGIRRWATGSVIRAMKFTSRLGCLWRMSSNLFHYEFVHGTAHSTGAFPTNFFRLLRAYFSRFTFFTMSAFLTIASSLARSVLTVLQVFAMRAQKVAQILANVLELFGLQQLCRFAATQIPHDG